MAIGMIWLTISLSALLVVPLLWVKVLMFAIAICVSIYLLRQPTWEPENEPTISAKHPNPIKNSIDESADGLQDK